MKKEIEFKMLDIASKNINILYLSRYFKNSDYPAAEIEIKLSNGRTLKTSPVYNILNNVKNLNQIEKLFEKVFSNNEKFFHDLHALGYSDFRKGMVTKIIDLVRKESGYDLLQNTEMFLKEKKYKKYQKFYKYINKISNDVPGYVLDEIYKQKSNKFKFIK